VVVDEAGELRWQDDGVADDRQVGVIRVVVEVVGGEFDDAGQREGVEADEGCGDANVRRKRGVVQAPAQFLVVVFFDLELAGELGGPVLDGQSGPGEVAGAGPADERDGAGSQSGP
jgi:hypothetical protein